MAAKYSMSMLCVPLFTSVVPMLLQPRLDLLIGHLIVPLLKPFQAILRQIKPPGFLLQENMHRRLDQLSLYAPLINTPHSNAHNLRRRRRMQPNRAPAVRAESPRRPRIGLVGAQPGIVGRVTNAQAARCVCGPGEGVDGEAGKCLVWGARGLAAGETVAMAYGFGERGGCVRYVSTAAAATKNDVFLGWHLDIMRFGHS